MDKLVSVITPCYNASGHIGRYLGSILRQKYTNLELILVNDGSTDDTEAVIRRYEKQLSDMGIRVKYIFQHNKGLGGAVNTGLKHISGEFFAWCDADNFYTPDYFSEKIRYMELHPSCAIVRCDGYVVREGDVSFPLRRMSCLNKEVFKEELFENALKNENFHYGCAMIRTSLFDEVCPGREIYESREGQNWQLLLPVLYRYKSGYIDRPMFCFVVREGSLSDSADRSSPEVKLAQLGEYRSIMINTLTRMDMDGDRQKYLSVIEDRHTLYIIMALPRYGAFKQASELYRGYRGKDSLTFKERLYCRCCASPALYALYGAYTRLRGALERRPRKNPPLPRVPGGAGEYVLFGVPKSRCTGCCACMNACPLGCISMIEDGEGFRYPSIDAAKCVGCGKCEGVCPAVRDVPRFDKVLAYACYNRDEEERLSSSSGGIFQPLARYVLDRGGYVYGAGFGEGFGAVHSRAGTYDEAKEFKGSKYVQSHIGWVYRDVKEKLEGGSPVLFTGTPCQCAGLKSFLGRDWDSLLCADFICHGVPSPAVWRDYLRLLSGGKTPTGVSFRDKRGGWKNYSLRIDFSDGQVIERVAKSKYLRGFVSDVFLRPSCYSCRYKSVERCSDITLADLWGAEYLLPGENDDKGLSLAVIRSAKGADAFAGIMDNLYCAEIDLDRALEYNPSAVRPAIMRNKRRMFFEAYGKVPFGKLMDAYCGRRAWDILKSHAYRMAARIIKLLRPPR